MASATKVPPMPPAPPPPMRPRQPRSFAGPVVLILIGVLFLLGNMGLIEFHRLGYWFAHYWPALLILWGIIKLIEYQNANRAGVHPRGIGAGGVLSDHLHRHSGIDCDRSLSRELAGIPRSNAHPRRRPVVGAHLRLHR